jgi:hypothetical protein
MSKVTVPDFLPRGATRQFMGEKKQLFSFCRCLRCSGEEWWSTLLETKKEVNQLSGEKLCCVVDSRSFSILRCWRSLKKVFHFELLINNFKQIAKRHTHRNAALASSACKCILDWVNPIAETIKSSIQVFVAEKNILFPFQNFYDENF